jgi:hypothetical protein
MEAMEPALSINVVAGGEMGNQPSTTLRPIGLAG